MHHIVIPRFVDRPRRSDCTAGQIDGEAGWWTTSGKIKLPPLEKVMGEGRQEQIYLLENCSSQIAVLSAEEIQRTADTFGIASSKFVLKNHITIAVVLFQDINVDVQ